MIAPKRPFVAAQTASPLGGRQPRPTSENADVVVNHALGSLGTFTLKDHAVRRKR